MTLPGVLRFQCSPDVSPQTVGSGWISEPQRGPTVGVGIIPPVRIARWSLLPRRLPQESRLWLDFRAPERANSSRWNHGRTTAVTDFSALQTSPPRMSALAEFPSPRKGRLEGIESNHWPCPVCCDLGALQTSPSRISVPAGFQSPREGQQ